MSAQLPKTAFPGTPGVMLPDQFNAVFLSGSVDAVKDDGRRWAVVPTPPKKEIK